MTKAGWKLYGILIIIIFFLFFGREMITEFRISRSMSKVLDQYPELPYDPSVIETEAVLKSIFQDQMPPDCLLQMTLIWKNGQWNLTTLTGLETYLENPAVQTILHETLAHTLPSPDVNYPEGWFPQRMCEIVRTGPDLRIKILQGMRESYSQELRTEYIHPFRDFGYPVGQSPREDFIQKELKQQEISLQESEKENSFLGEALILNDYSLGMATVSINIPHIDNPSFEEALGQVLSSHFQELMKFNPSVTFSVKDEFGEAKKEYSSQGISEEKRWIIRLPHEDGFLYYLVPFLK